MKILKTVFAIALLSSPVFAQEVRNTNSNELEKERAYQISFVPGLSSGQGAKEGYTNKFSLNLFAGYEYALHGCELGMFYNIDKSNIKGAQLAGFGNTVLGSVHGAQLAGFVNTTKGKVTGFQGAGFVNITASDVKGVQMAGFVNLADSIKGVQAAGFSNVATKGVKGVQMSGFSNVADSIKGAQLAGLGNWSAKGVDGAQVAGLMNLAKDVKGVQVAGLLNRASHVHGTQIGLINIADSIESGVAVGLINIVKSGRHEFAIEYNEVMDMNVAFRSGTDRLYSILFAGMQGKSDFLWSYGAGFGTQFRMKNNWISSVELTTQTINPKDDHHENLNLLNRLSWNFGYQMANHLSFSAGPVLNIYVTQVYDQETGKYGDDIDKGSFYNKTFSDTNVKMWVGYNISIKF